MHDAQNLSPGIINRKEKERKEGRKKERGRVGGREERRKED
jgi:hypothetical protein